MIKLGREFFSKSVLAALCLNKQVLYITAGQILNKGCNFQIGDPDLYSLDTVNTLSASNRKLRWILDVLLYWQNCFLPTLPTEMRQSVTLYRIQDLTLGCRPVCLRTQPSTESTNQQTQKYISSFSVKPPCLVDFSKVLPWLRLSSPLRTEQWNFPSFPATVQRLMF